MQTVVDYLNGVPLAGLMLVVTCGYSLGRVTFRRVSLGPAAGTLFAALWMGHLGLEVGPPGSEVSYLGKFGFALFIYSVGFEAGPRFFGSFRDRLGWRFICVGVVVTLLAVGCALLCGWFFELKGATVAGLLAGALTSAPAFAAASEMTTERAQLSIAFAITYPVGLLGLVLLIQVLPKLLRDNLAPDAAHEEEFMARFRRTRRALHESKSPEVTRTFEVTSEEVTGQLLRKLNLTGRTGCVISRVYRREEIGIAVGDTRLEIGDQVVATGRVDELREFQKLIGPEVNRGLHKTLARPRRIRVRKKEVVGRSLAQLGITNQYKCVITKIERGDFLIEPGADVTLSRNDIVEVVGRRNAVRKIAALLGNFESSVEETDIAVYAGGILLGLLLGSIHVRLGGFDVRLGMAAGLLLVGLVLSRLGHVGRLRMQVPRAARQLVRDLGILLFVGDIGLHAGADVADGLSQAAWVVLASGLAVMLVAVMGALAVGRVVLRLRPIDTWGSICGGLTSTAALHAVRRVADSSEAAISYAAAYAVASVLATLAGQVVIQLMG
jgi:putative transport protein